MDLWLRDFWAFVYRILGLRQQSAISWVSCSFRFLIVDLQLVIGCSLYFVEGFWPSGFRGPVVGFWSFVVCHGVAVEIGDGWLVLESNLAVDCVLIAVIGLTSRLSVETCSGNGASGDPWDLWLGLPTLRRLRRWWLGYRAKCWCWSLYLPLYQVPNHCFGANAFQWFWWWTSLYSFQWHSWWAIPD